MVWAINSAAQECNSPEDIVVLESQQAVDEFQTNHGPCDVLLAALYIEGDDITDLTPLQDLVQIGDQSSHDLRIGSNPMLQSLEGLHNIRSVEGDLTISNYDSLTDLSGLLSLEEVRQILSISGNEKLRNLVGIDSLKSFGWKLEVYENPMLESLHGYSNAEPVDLDSLFILDNDLLVDLNGLPQIRGTNLELEVIGNDKLKSLNGLDVVDYVGPGRVHIEDNDVLENLQGLEWVTQAHFMVVINNSKLKNLDGLNNLSKVTWNFVLLENASLTSLSGLESLEQVGTFGTEISNRGHLLIYMHPNLVDLNALDSLLAVDWVTVGENPKLAECAALRSLLDVIDHGAPGPGAGPLEYSSSVYHIPDVQSGVLLVDNAIGCNTVEDIAFPEPVVERVLTGSWYDPDSSGEGFMIHAVQAHSVNPFVNEVGLAIGYFYGYDENGDRFWLIGVHEGDMQWDAPIEFTASYVEGGNFEDFDPDDVTESPWGTFTFTPLHCDAGTIVLQGQFDEEGEVQQKTLNVLRLGKVSGDYCTEQTSRGFSDTLTASWFDSKKAGEGFALHKINEETGIVYFYGFDTNGKPLWLIGVWSGQVELGETIEIPMAQVSGGFFDEVDPENIVEEPWGTLELDMAECESGQAILYGIDGEQSFAIEQLASSLGLECL